MSQSRVDIWKSHPVSCRCEDCAYVEAHLDDDDDSGGGEGGW